MAKNRMEEIAKMLGIEMEVPFNIKQCGFEQFKFTRKGLVNSKNDLEPKVFYHLLRGGYDIGKPILDEVEKRYLEGVIRPFKDRVLSITKTRYSCSGSKVECICILFWESEESVCIKDIMLPYFRYDAMYKGMKGNREYTIKELGLFQDREGE